MKYINTKTQAVIETACVLSGGYWKKVEYEQPKKTTKTSKSTKKVVKKDE